MNVLLTPLSLLCENETYEGDSLWQGIRACDVKLRNGNKNRSRVTFDREAISQVY